MITGVLTDRLQRRNEAVADITSSWGKEQSVIGPVLGIPYQYKFKAVKEMPAPDGKMERREVEETAITNAYFLPETLNVSGDAQTQMLHRGIYAAAVFRAQMKLSGKFAPPDFHSVRHAHHTPSNTAESATSKAANVSMKQAHLPARFMPHGGVVRHTRDFT